MKRLESEDRIIFKQKALCKHSAAHKKQEAIYVCIETSCVKQALCATCVSQEHARHQIESIQDIKQRAITVMDQQGKLEQNKEIILLEQVEQLIHERYLNMQVAIGRSLKNFNERIHLYKDSVKREQLDILYQIEFACEAIQSGKPVSQELFHKNLNLLNACVAQQNAAGIAGLAKTTEHFLQIKRVDVLRAELQLMSEKLLKYQQNFSETLTKYTDQFNRIFAEGVEDDEFADPKLKLFKNNNNILSARQSISFQGDPHAKSRNEDSFDMIDSLQFLVNEISDDNDYDDEDDASANKNQSELGQHSQAEAEISNDNNSSARPSIRKQNNRSHRPSIRKATNANDTINIIVQIDDDSFAQIEEQVSQHNNQSSVDLEMQRKDERIQQADKILGRYELQDQVDLDCPSHNQFTIIHNHSKYYPSSQFLIQMLSSQTGQFFVYYKLTSGANSIRGPFETEECAVKYYDQKIEEQRQVVLKQLN